MTQSDAEGLAIDLEGVVVLGDRNLFTNTTIPGIEGARAALETFYYAFNTHSLDLLRKILANDTLAQVDTPLAGLIRGYEAISSIYDRMASSLMRIQTVLNDIFCVRLTGAGCIYRARKRYRHARQ